MNTTPLVDNHDWLKTAAIILVAVDHFGYFFIEDADWWNVFGRLAAPCFFFLLGYAQTRRIPPHWILLGLVLTLLESWNTDWEWVTPNILFSFVLIRLARPGVQSLLERHGWLAFTIVVVALLATLPLTMNIVDYGSEGWLWALFGLCQRVYVDRKATKMTGSWMRLAACFVAATSYIWFEQQEFLFAQPHLTVFVLGMVVLCFGLSMFSRGSSPGQPPQPVAGVLRFVGRHTLEIYAIQLAGSEIIIGIMPNLAA